MAEGQISATVIAPVPYFPFRSRVWGRYARYASIPGEETRHNITVHHPRFLALPRIGSRLTPLTLAAAARKRLNALIAKGLEFDLIDAHYFYPDAIAASQIAREFAKPFVVTARGSDLTQHTSDPRERRDIIAAAHEATALITVSNSLKEELVKLGINPSRIAVLRNGVETSLFRPQPVEALGSRTQSRKHKLLSVGALIPRKSHDIAIRAMTELPDCELKIAGVGPLQGELQNLIEQLGLGDRVKLLGEIAHRDLPKYYSEADLMVLMSSREGWANVILESLACGTPVVASNVGGANEIILSPVAGVVVNDRTPASLAQATRDFLLNMPERAKTRTYAEAFGWQPVARSNSRLLVAASLSKTPLQNIADEYSVHGAEHPLP